MKQLKTYNLSLITASILFATSSMANDKADENIEKIDIENFSI